MEASGSDWVLSSRRVAASYAGDALPQSPGLYAVFVDDPGRLPKSFGRELAARSNPHLLYVGQASVSLHDRVWEAEFQHKSPGTFFRSVGVTLGYVSPKGGKNFEFAAPDKALITNWIKRHLEVAWTTTVQKLNDQEKAAIRRHCPLLNLKDNPKKLPLLTALRATSRRGAGHVG